MKLCTIGIYGFTEETFFQSLQSADVQVLVDTRRRRGVRGAHYAFANSVRLQEGLKARGMRYVHYLDLAPSTELIKMQDQYDVKRIGSRRKREGLLKEFKQRYAQECLMNFDLDAFLGRGSLNDGVFALLCVEENPAACHRGLLAAFLADEYGASVRHLVP